MIVAAKTSRSNDANDRQMSNVARKAVPQLSCRQKSRLSQSHHLRRSCIHRFNSGEKRIVTRWSV